MCNTWRPDLLSFPLSPLLSHGCLAWRCCRTAEVKTIQMWYDIVLSEGLGGEPRVLQKLGTETFQNYCLMCGLGLTPQLKMQKPKKAAQNEQLSVLQALCTAEQQSMEEWQKPCSFWMSLPILADPMSSKEGIPKSRVKIILENRARVGWEVDTPKLAKAEQQVLFSEENRSCCMFFLVFISPSLVFGLSRAGWPGWFILSQQCFIIPGSSSVLIHPASCSPSSIWEAESSWPNAELCVLPSWIPSWGFFSCNFSFQDHFRLFSILEVPPFLLSADLIRT